MDKYKIIQSGKARFTVITENVIRCEYSEKEVFSDADTLFCVNRAHNGCEVKVVEDGDRTVISTDFITLTYVNDGRCFNSDNLYAEILGAKWAYGDTNKENLGGTLPTLDGVQGRKEVNDGLLSKDGWFVIDDSQNPPIENGWITTNSNKDETDIYLFGYGRDYKLALRTLAYVSGKAALPRKYVFGSWYSRWWPYTDEEIEQIVDEYDQNDFPLDIMVIDMDWHHHDWTCDGSDEAVSHRATYGYGHAGNLGWTGYSWNRDLIKNPKQLLARLHDRGIAVTLNDHPHDGIRTHEDCYGEFMNALGLPAESGINLEFDASDKRYMDAFFATSHADLERDGVDFWWVDWQQNAIKPYIKGTRLRHIPWLNYCYYNHSREGGKRGISYSRWGGFGDQKHPIYFSGDTGATWECLDFEVDFTVKSSNAGLFYWGHDTGGFFGERNPEMFVRWTQFTGLSACLRVHSLRDENLDRRPWKWGEEYAAAMREVYHLRSKLLPYIYSSAYQCYEQTLPLIRAMYIEYPSVDEAYLNPQQYMFGDALLVSPVTRPLNGACSVKQKVWIKEGAYYDLFTNEKYGAGEHYIDCPLDRFPLLVKGGVPIPMQPYTSRMTSEPLNTLEIVCYPAQQGEFTLYEDDGISSEYETGACLKTKLSYSNDGERITVKIEPDGGKYNGMPELRDYVIRLPLTDRELHLDGGICATVEFADGTNTVTAKGVDINRSLEFVLS